MKGVMSLPSGVGDFCKGLGPVSDFHLSPSVIQFPVSALMLSDDRKDIILNLIRLSLRVAFFGVGDSSP